MQHFLEPVAPLFYNLRLPPASQCKMAKAALKVQTSIARSAGLLLPGYMVPTTVLQILQGKIPLVFFVYVFLFVFRKYFRSTTWTLLCFRFCSTVRWGLSVWNRLGSARGRIHVWSRCFIKKLLPRHLGLSAPFYSTHWKHYTANDQQGLFHFKMLHRIPQVF